MPALRYGEGAPVFEVVAGKLTDAGEYILETPPGTPITEKQALKVAQKQPQLFRMRVRPGIRPLEAAFGTLPAGPAPEVPAEFVSTISCRARPKGAMMYLPFEC